MDGMGDPIQSPSLTYPIAKITVSGNDFSLSFTEMSDLLLISDKLYSYGTRAPSSNGTTNEEVVDKDVSPEDNGEDVSGSIMDSTNAVYTITLVMHEGEEIEYQLSGNTLKNLNTDLTYTLSQTQVNELQELLGIPQS